MSPNDYFFKRQGLISDEIDWPSAKNNSTSSSQDHNTLAGDNNNIIDSASSSSWRVRDNLTNLLGAENSIIQSSTGLTLLEIAQLENEQADNNESASHSTHHHNNQQKSNSSEFAAFTASLIDIDSSILQRHSLCVEYVTKAFDAASFAILRGDERSNSNKLLVEQKVEGVNNSISVSNNNRNQSTEDTDQQPAESNNTTYDAPIIMAMESIRTSRITTLSSAYTGSSKGSFGSDIGATAKPVPAFLKKNATIPWFHLPCAGGTFGSGSRAGTPANSRPSTPASAGGGVGSKAANEKTVSSDKKKQQSSSAKAKKRSADVPTSNEGDNNTKRVKVEVDENDTIMSSHKKTKKKSTSISSVATSSMTTPAAKKRAPIPDGTVSSSLPKPTTPSSSSFSSSKSPKKRKIKRTKPSSIITEEQHDTIIANNPNLSRAILSAATGSVFQDLNDGNGNAASVAEDVDIAKIVNEVAAEPSTNKLSPSKTKDGINNNNNMDIVISRATRLGSQALGKSRGAAIRSDQRREFRIDNALSKLNNSSDGVGGDNDDDDGINGRRNDGSMISSAHALPLVVPNPFIVSPGSTDAEDSSTGSAAITVTKDTPVAIKKLDNNDTEWTDTCLPRLLDVMSKGAGHAVVHDMQWTERSVRVANLLQNLARQQPASSSSTTPREAYSNYGPHLIVTSSGDDFDKFASVFGQLGSGVHSSIFKKDDGEEVDDVILRALPYQGSKKQRRQLRKHFGSLMPSSGSHFAFLAGLRDSPFHVIITTYSVLMEDYAHFCQIPFQVVVLDDGMSWLGCSQADPSGKLGEVWNTGLWNNTDFGAGRAGQGSKSWNFSKDVVEAEKKPKSSSSSSSSSSSAITEGSRSSSGKPLIGLTARHRILLASNMHTHYRDSTFKAPVLGLLSFLAPQFADTIKSDWEKSRIFSCKMSMTYIRSMLARLIVIYGRSFIGDDPNDLMALSLKALDGKLPLRSMNPTTSQEDEGLDELVKSQKIVVTRKFAVAWFRPFSAIRKETSLMSLDPILSAVKKANAKGFVCEEIATTSSLTPAGAGGSIVGISAYRPAARCGRCFNSELGLKLHIASMHAPPGKWLCRSCGEDCGTNVARAAHEKVCSRAPRRVSLASSPTKAVATVTTGDGDEGPSSSGKKKKPGAKARQVVHSSGEPGDDDPTVATSSSGGNNPNTPLPDLSVIDIKKLPPHVKPLLRDPNFTPRTGGSTKRYVYAYRGVCRQQRKGYDRWQSQISANGQNHYLGTFDSEWEAAAVYAWAHLILYGEEATRKAAQEGEEAAAAFAQQEKDVAEGKIPPPSSSNSKSATKKKRNSSASKKKQLVVDTSVSAAEKEGDHQSAVAPFGKGSSLLAGSTHQPIHTRKKRPASQKEWSKLKTECAMMLSSGTKGTSKATILATRKDVGGMNEAQLLSNVSGFTSGKLSSVSKTFLQQQTTAAKSLSSSSAALLIGLDAIDFGWNTKTFVDSCDPNDMVGLSIKLTTEFGANGPNKSFRAFVLSSPFTLGRTTSNAHENRYLTSESSQAAISGTTLGMAVGNVDCNVGGPDHSCSGMAAKIELVPTKYGKFQFMACNDDDIVTLNGQRVTASTGPCPLRDRDICSVGARVFVFVEKMMG